MRVHALACVSIRHCARPWAWIRIHAL